jgi:hypothetical protein
MSKIISNVVFTKNRPLQLDAYLESLYRYYPQQLIQTYVIYKVELFDREYGQLFRKYPDCVVIRENDFHSDFLKILSQINTKYVLFGIDDVVFFDSVDFGVIEDCFNKFPDDIFGFSLRHCTEIITGGDDIKQVTVFGQTVRKFNWKDGKTDLTAYPIDLCCTIYPTALVKKIIHSTMNNNPLVRKLFSPPSFFIKALGKMKFRRSILKSFGYFFSPNTLESWNCRWCQNHTDQLPHYLYFQKLCASAIQVNMVNTSTKNVFVGIDEHTVEAINDKYKQGYRLDIDFIAVNKPQSLSGGQQYFKLTASGQPR